MAAWKLAPVLAAGNCGMKPAEQTPASIMVLMELIADLLPEGVVNIVSGFGLEAKPCFIKESRKSCIYWRNNHWKTYYAVCFPDLIPVTLELGGKSPNVFFEDVMSEDDAFFDKCLEGFTMFALQGEVCTCPSRALIQESIYDRFMEKR